MGYVSVLLFGVYERTNGKTNSWSETLCCLTTTHFIHDVYGGTFKWSDKKINEQSCESSSRSTPGLQLLAVTSKSQDFVWEMYENQALFCVKQRKQNWVETHQAQLELVCATKRQMHHSKTVMSQTSTPISDLYERIFSHAMGRRVSPSYWLYGDRLVNLTNIFIAL